MHPLAKDYLSLHSQGVHDQTPIHASVCVQAKAASPACAHGPRAQAATAAPRYQSGERYLRQLGQATHRHRSDRVVGILSEYLCQHAARVAQAWIIALQP